MITKFKKNRIIELTKKGLTSSVIAERLGTKRVLVYQLQVRHGLRIPKKKGGESK